jgi:uncharacterized membrane protein
MKILSSVLKSINKSHVLLLVCGVIGLTASVILTYDKIQLLKDPANIPACTINPIISCTSAMSSPQSEIMGMPLSIVGIMAYTALVAVSVLLIVGVKLPKQIWTMIISVALIGVLGIHYLILESIFILHIICPWCFTVWVTMPLMFIGSCIGYKSIGLPKRLSTVDRIIGFISSNASTIAAIWYGLLVIALLSVFWDFWVSVIP